MDIATILGWWGLAIGVIGLVIGVIGLFLAWYYSRKSEKQQKHFQEEMRKLLSQIKEDLERQGIETEFQHGHIQVVHLKQAELKAEALPIKVITTPPSDEK